MDAGVSTTRGSPITNVQDRSISSSFPALEDDAVLSQLLTDPPASEISRLDAERVYYLNYAVSESNAVDIIPGPSAMDPGERQNKRRVRGFEENYWSDLCFKINEAHFQVEKLQAVQHLDDEISCCVGYMLYYMEHLSAINPLNHDEAFRRLFFVLNMIDLKRIGLIFMGPSNCGKTQFLEIIKCAYQEDRTGHVNRPSGNKLKDFWLQEARA